MLSLIDWFKEKIELVQLRWKMRDADPKVRGLVILIHNNPGIIQKSPYDRTMENYFARHPRTRQTTRPTPYKRGAIT